MCQESLKQTASEGLLCQFPSSKRCNAWLERREAKFGRRRPADLVSACHLLLQKALPQSCHGSRRQFNGKGSSLEPHCCAQPLPLQLDRWLHQGLTVRWPCDYALPYGTECQISRILRTATSAPTSPCHIALWCSALSSALSDYLQFLKYALSCFCAFRHAVSSAWSVPFPICLENSYSVSKRGLGSPSPTLALSLTPFLPRRTVQFPLPFPPHTHHAVSKWLVVFLSLFL